MISKNGHLVVTDNIDLVDFRAALEQKLHIQVFLEKNGRASGRERGLWGGRIKGGGVTRKQKKHIGRGDAK